MTHERMAMKDEEARRDVMIAMNHQMIAVDHERKARDQAATLVIRSGELLKLRGRLSMRGVFDHIEEEQRMTRSDVHNLSRTQLWGRILGDREDLRNCIRHTMSAHDRNVKEEEYVVGIYKTLSAHIHCNKSPLEHAGGDAVDIVEDSLSDRQCRALDCICEAFAFPRRLHLRTNTEAWVSLSIFTKSI